MSTAGSVRPWGQVPSHGAVSPGTDLGAHARLLRVAHDAVLSGDRPAHAPRDLVVRSWRRVLAHGLDADAATVRDPLPLVEVERRRRASPIGTVIDDLRHVLTSVADASTFLMVVTDGDGVVLWREGSARVRMQADRLGFAEGAVWTEQAVGTNAIGTALAEAAPVELFSAEHFENAQIPWYCSAWPMHDPRTGDLLGVVDVSGPAMTLHPAIRMLVESAVRLAEARLADLHRAHLEQIRRQAEPLLVGAGGPLLVVDDLGWVAHHSGVAHRPRIEAPHPDRPVAVPGLGVCLPERLSDGWLVRPQGAAGVVRARLDETAGALVVESGDDTWRTPLTRRHVELLRLVASAGPGGVGAGELSTALYGDSAHVVTVRAEMSRLRRRIGALLETAPYRVAAGVALSVEG